MPKTSIVSTTEIAEAGRFDAEYFQSDWLTMATTLGRVRTDPLVPMCSVSDGNHLTVKHLLSSDPSVGPRYLRGQDIGGFFLGARNPVFVPADVFSQLSRSHMAAGDVLVSIVGTIGAISLVPDESPTMTGSCKIAIIRPQGVRIAPEYLAGFLASRYGQAQIHRNVRGAVQMGLILPDLRQVRIARLGDVERQVVDLVREATEAKTAERTTRSDAAGYFESSLGIDPPLHVDELAYQTTLDEVTSRNRWDAEHFRPRYARVMASVLAARSGAVDKVSPLARVLRVLTNGHTPLRHDLTVGDVRFITAEHVSDFRIDYESAKRILLRHHEKELARTALQPGDLVMTIKGKVGNCAVVTTPPGSSNINQDVALLRFNEQLSPYYVAGWFNSAPGKEMVQQFITGGINPFLALNTVRQLPIPIVDRATHDAIAADLQGLAETAEAQRQRAAQLLAEAVHLIDVTVESQAE